MAARAALLGDVGESAPANREKPFSTHDVHVVLGAVCGEEGRPGRGRTIVRDAPTSSYPACGRFACSPSGLQSDLVIDPRISSPPL